MIEILSPQEFRNAIYFDFEGEGRKSGISPKPHMAGFFRPKPKGGGGTYRCLFFKPSWRPASNGIASANCKSFQDTFEDLTSELEREHAHLIFWTQHEEKMLERLPDHLFFRLKPWLYNLHPLAKKYANKTRKFGLDGKAAKKTLEDFFAAMYRKRHPYPPFPLGPAEACRRIDRACKAEKRWKRFSAKQQGYVRDLVEYNGNDCRTTWLIARRLGNFYSAR